MSLRPDSDAGARALGIDLSPDLQRPLSPWRPFDYLKLLYWVFFFPQALRGYEEKWVAADRRGVRGRYLWPALRSDVILRQWVVMGAFTGCAFPIAMGGAIQTAGGAIDWLGLTVGMLLGLVIGVVAGRNLGTVVGLVVGLNTGLSFGLALGVAFIGEVMDLESAALGGATAGMAFGLSVCSAFAAVGGAAIGLFFGLPISIFVGVYLGLSIFLNQGLALGSCVAASFILLAALMILRLPDTFIVTILGRRGTSRVSLIPDSNLKSRLTLALERSWQEGILACDHLLGWTLQFAVVFPAIQEQMESMECDDLLLRVGSLSESDYATDYWRFGSIDLSHAMAREVGDSVVSLVPFRSWSEYWKSRFPTEPRLELGHQAACAGFHFWNSGKVVRAREAFEKVQVLANGEELFVSASAMAAASRVETVEALAGWSVPAFRLEGGRTSFLRPGAVRALRLLDQTAEAVAGFGLAASMRARQDALAQAIGDLQTLLDEGPSFCEHPEWPLIREIAEEWRNLVGRAVRRVAEEAARCPVENPFLGYSGRPVRGHAFVGRIGALSEIERFLRAPSSPALFVYGHRRMGKTSVLLNLDAHLGEDVLLVYLDMQGLVNQIDGPGDLLFDICRALVRRLKDIGLELEPTRQEEFTIPGAAWRRFADTLRDLEPALSEKRLILAFDEFEYLESALVDQQLDRELLQSLRSLQNELPWLALVFGGLHTLGEMNGDYWFPFYSQAESILVSYLTREESTELLCNPSPDFDLVFNEDLLDELYRLTYGQPYLLQRLAWELVESWNSRFLTFGSPPDRTVTRDDLAPLVDESFFVAASYYFDGLWQQLDDEERRLATLLGQRRESWPLGEMEERVQRLDLDLSAVLEKLVRHDVVLVDTSGGTVRFASDLFRQWLSRRS